MLGRKSALLPVKTAVRTCDPVVVKVTSHEPLPSVRVTALHSTVLPSFKSTVPVGVSPPLISGATVKLTVTGVLTTDGSGVSEVMVVMVLNGGAKFEQVVSVFHGL